MSTSEPASEPERSEQSCFHCGLPLDPAFSDPLEVNGKSRDFCCGGCRAVCAAIVEAGLSEYYAHRREKAVTADVVPDIVKKLGFYDRPEVQQSFVKGAVDRKEAALLLENIRCPACLWLNEQVLRGLDGVFDVEIDYTSNQARVAWDPAHIKLSEILEAITSIGYVAHPYDPARREQLLEKQRQRSTERLIFAAVIGMVVMNYAIAGYVMGGPDETGETPLWIRIGRWTNLIATTALLSYPAQEFFIGAWRDLRNRRLGMDVPIVLGLSFAYVGSIHTTLTGVGEVYYDSIAMFVFLVLLARRFELRGRLSAADALDRVDKIIPRTARRLDEGQHETEVLVTDLKPGDRVRVLPGEAVPSDGVLAEGHSSFDESLLTGEPLPVDRHAGDPVLGGACNVDQPITVEIRQASIDSTVAEINRLLARGMRDAPSYAVLAQRIAGWFVAAILMIATATAITWWLIDAEQWLTNTVAVLIVTCPCALALATPVAVAVSTGRFAELGVLPVRSDAIETLAQIDRVAFDKTGTLTFGNLSLEETRAFGDLGTGRVQAIAAAMERDSEHPAARAFRSAQADIGLRVSGLGNHPGRGVSGRIDEIDWRLGRPEYAAAGLPRDSAMTRLIKDWRDQGYLVIALASDQGVAALFALRDQPRPGVEGVFADLRASGVERVFILSGDQQDSVERFAARLECDGLYGSRSPAEKLELLNQLRGDSGRIMMVGDGINDAPTLAAADVSMAFAGATELAQVSSDFLLLSEDPGRIPQARELAIVTRRVIRQNLTWAALYNLLAVPAAALGLIAPWGAAIGMSLSSLLVVANALRLKRSP